MGRGGSGGGNCLMLVYSASMLQCSDYFYHSHDFEIVQIFLFILDCLCLQNIIEYNNMANQSLFQRNWEKKGINRDMHMKQKL